MTKNKPTIIFVDDEPSVLNGIRSLMPENLQRQIQDDPSSMKTSKFGTGLGLTIVSHCIKNHCGFLKVDSVLNKGTTFQIFLPIFTEEIE